MIIGLTFIGFVYGILLSGRYGNLEWGMAGDAAYIVGWTFAGGIAGWVFQNIPRAFSKRDILRSMCSAVGFLYGVWLHRQAMIDDHSFTIWPIFGWSIVGNFVGYIVHNVFGKDTDEEITAPAPSNPKQKEINSVLASYQWNNPDTNITQWIQPRSSEPVTVHYTNSKGDNKATRVRPDSISLSFRNNVLLLKIKAGKNLNFDRISNPEVLGFQTTPTVNPEARDPEPQQPPLQAPDKDSCPSCNNSNVRLWEGEYRCWHCGYVLRGQDPEIEPSPPTLEEQHSPAESNPPVLEPEAFIVGNSTGTELLYTRNNGDRGVIYFDPDSIELTDSHVTLQATGTTARFSILRERILNPDVLSPPLITEEEELPPVIEPTRKIIGDPSGQKLIYTRNNGEEGLIFFEPNSLEITAERIIVSPYHTQEEYAIERVRIKNLQELINPTQTELPLLPPTLPDVASTTLTPVTPAVQWKPGTRVIIEELPIDTYEATQIMRRLKPNLNTFEVLEAVKFKPERDQLLQGYNPAIAEDIKTDFEAAGCTVSLQLVEDREVEADQVAPFAPTHTETLKPVTISGRTPTEEEFHEIRMGTDRHRIFDLINSSELNLKAKDKHGHPILHGCQRASIASLLIERGADVMACDDSGNSALHNCDDSSVMEVLIGAELPVDAMNKNRETALHKWVFQGRLAPVKTLIHFGANPIHPNSDGETPLELAWQGLAKYDDGEHEQIIELLNKQTL